MQPTGSFASSIGGGDPIKAAMQRRGISMGVTGQSTVTPNQGPQSPPGQPSMPQPQAGSMNATGAVTTPDEDSLIIKALTGRLTSNSKIKEAHHIPQNDVKKNLTPQM